MRGTGQKSFESCRFIPVLITQGIGSLKVLYDLVNLKVWNCSDFDEIVLAIVCIVSPPMLNVTLFLR